MVSPFRVHDKYVVYTMHSQRRILPYDYITRQYIAYFSSATHFVLTAAEDASYSRKCCKYERNCQLLNWNWSPFASPPFEQTKYRYGQSKFNLTSNSLCGQISKSSQTFEFKEKQLCWSTEKIKHCVLSITSFVSHICFILFLYVFLFQIPPTSDPVESHVYRYYSLYVASTAQRLSQIHVCEYFCVVFFFCTSLTEYICVG